ncbi:MAG TPA: glycosyl hydrolase family 18 protein [Candidatus Acidoferrum sp.]|nr:glycosyl hydrolase family 18 protein [Candidatus Acidoferrum sp.]
MKRALLFSPLLCVIISVSLLAQASVSLSPSSYNFGSTAVDTGTAWVTFTLSNSGSSAVSISNVTVSGPFVVSSNCGSSVAANGSCPIYVYFYPTAAGAASGTLTVTDSATNSPQTSSLSGTGGSGGSCTTTPSAPTGLAASGTTGSGTNLSWTADTPPANCTISSYTVLQNGTSIGTATGTTFTVSGLAASTSYSFTVEATDGNGTSGPSSAVNVTTLANSCNAKPSAPTGLAASGTTSSGTNLTWTTDTPPSGCTISSYTVLQNGSSIGTATGTSFAVSGLAASTTYSFTLEATDANGTSGASSPVSVTTSASGGSGCATAWSSTAVYTQGMTASQNGENYVANFWTQNQSPATNNGGSGSGQPWTATGPCSSCSSAPAVPTGLAASGTTSSSTNLSWTAVNPPAGCSVSYKVLQNGATIASPTTTSDAVTGLTPSTTYSFTVEATDAVGTSAASSAVSVTTSASSCTTKPTTPTGLAASGTTDSSTNLSWNAVTPPNGCTITNYTVLQNGSAIGTTTSTSYTPANLSPSTSYSFTVEATDYAGTSGASSAVKVTTSALTNLVMAGWYEEWGTYYANANVADLQNNGVAGVLTHLIYAFAKPTANGSNVNCALADSYADYQKNVPQVPGATPATAPLQGNFGALVQLKQLHPNLKVLISIGGWNPPTYNQLFDTAASTAAQRQAFVGSCINMFIQGNIASGVSTGTLFDGFDIDWEFPNANDTANFTALMTEFRNELTTLSGTTGKTYQLLADLAAGPSTPGAAADSGNDGGYDTINIGGLNAVLDYMNVDGYNYAGDWSNATNDASPLYDETASPLYGKGDTIDATVQYYLAHGASPAKYTMGFPLYGVGWTGSLTSANSGMYQNATGTTDPTGAQTPNGTAPVPNINGVGNCPTGQNQGGPAAGCDFLLTDGMATYRSIVNLLNNGFTPSYDATRCSARMFNPTTNTAFSYDNAESVQCKVNYIKQYGLGGGYVWAVKDDDPNGDLTKALASDLNP